MNVDTLLATVTEKVLEKPIIKLPNISLSFSDLFIVGIIFSVAYLIYTAIKLLIALQVKRNRIKKAQSKTLTQLISYIIAIFAVGAAFSSFGYSLTYFFLGSTALLVGLGFGLQQLFVDLISGIILLIDKNVNYGDVIDVDIPGAKIHLRGKIVQIGLRATQLETIDNEIMIVPNSRMLTSGVRSLMHGNGSARFRVTMQVSFDSDMDKVKKLMTKAVLSHEKADQEPKPTIIIKEFTDNGVLLEIRFWMKELFNSEIILSDIRFETLKLFRENNIEIPYPQRVMQEKK
jgi:small-conductance mechanosensitive channel